MESPIVKRIVSKVVDKPKRSFSCPMEVCLGDWWLSKPLESEGIAVSGHPIEMRRRDNTWKGFHSAPVKKRCATREFQSKQIAKRHGCTTLETADGYILSLCGFINKFRTQQNGFSSEVCRDFIYGFPLNWKVYVKECVGKESSSQCNQEYFSECIIPAALDDYNGAQLHDMVLSLTDTEREVLSKTMCDNLMATINPELLDGMNVLQPSSPTELGTDDDGFLFDAHVEQEGGSLPLSRPRRKCLTENVKVKEDSNMSQVKKGCPRRSSRKRICKRATETLCILD